MQVIFIVLPSNMAAVQNLSGNLYSQEMIAEMRSPSFKWSPFFNSNIGHTGKGRDFCTRKENKSHRLSMIF